MKKVIFLLGLCFSVSCFASDAKTDQCIKDTVAAKEDLQNGVTASFARIIPGYEEQLSKELADPSRCSLAWTKGE